MFLLNEDKMKKLANKRIIKRRKTESKVTQNYKSKYQIKELIFHLRSWLNR